MSHAASSATEIALEARHVTKRYPGVLALDRVTFRAWRNQVNVLIGENGAGKSTLMKILAGVEEADEGELLLDGAQVALRSPRDAAANGISIVHQELNSLTNLNISENVFAGRELRRNALFVDSAQQHARTGKALTRLRKPMNPATEAAHLPLGCRQLVEIGRTLDQGSQILILDEPTSALSAAESESLFRVIADLKRSGVTIIYISHRLHELLFLGDRFTVLRSGCVVGEAARAEVSRRWIVERMTGRSDFYEATRSEKATGSRIALSVNDLSLEPAAAGAASQARLDKVSFALREGEIVGVYGLLGAGRTELLEALAGFREMSSGSVEIYGKPVQIDSVRSAIRAGMVLLPEDRQRDGLFPDLSIRENIAMAATRGLLLSRADESRRVREMAADLRIAAKGIEAPVTALSGGNQQKALLARCLMRSPVVLLLDEPTRGVDVGAKAEIYAILRQLAGKGLSILFTSSEIEETRALADRVLVLCQGRISAEFAQAEAFDDQLFAAASPTVAAGAPSHSAPGNSA
jgi:erythritol transport system ATP-binding protein